MGNLIPETKGRKQRQLAVSLVQKKCPICHFSGGRESRQYCPQKAISRLLNFLKNTSLQNAYSQVLTTSSQQLGIFVIVQSYGSLGKSYLSPVLALKNHHITFMVTMSQFEGLETSLHLQLVSAFCCDLITMCNHFADFQQKNPAHWGN